MDCIIVRPVIPSVVYLRSFYPIRSIQSRLFDVNQMWIEISQLICVYDRLNGPDLLSSQVGVVLFEQKPKKGCASFGDHNSVAQGILTFTTDYERKLTKLIERLDNQDICVEVDSAVFCKDKDLRVGVWSQDCKNY